MILKVSKVGIVNKFLKLEHKRQIIEAIPILHNEMAKEQWKEFRDFKKRDAMSEE